jgi:hypothetical protein
MLENEKPKVGMPDDEEIVELMNQRIDENLMVGIDWRQYEVRDGFAMFEGNQWSSEATKRQTDNGLECFVINRVRPVLEAICGFEIQHRLEVNYSPRLLNPEQQGFNDICNNGVRYMEQQSRAASQRSLAFLDMLICGMGVTNTDITFNTNENGQQEVRRVFPAFIFYDVSARAKNIIDADYAIELKVTTKEQIEARYGVNDEGDVYDTGLDSRVLQFFESILPVKTLGCIYEYQWRQLEPFYRIENPFLKVNPLTLAPEQMQALQAQAMFMKDEYNFDPQRDRIFSVHSSKDLSELKGVFSELGIKLKYSEEKKYKYYRALVTGGRVISKSENWSQTGFSIKFMTGEFSELTQSYYGLMRACKDPQRMLNQSVSDFVAYLQTIPKGGVNIEEDAVSDINAFLDTYAKAKDVSIFASGALMAGKVMPKPVPPIPAGVVEMIQYADTQIMQVCGVTPELMGMMDSKEMNSGFYKQQIRQCLTTLSVYFDAKATYLYEQGMLNIDCLKVLVDNAEGRLVRNVLGEGDQEYIPLLKDGIAAEYDVIVEQMPTTPEENTDTFFKLIDLQKAMPDKNIMPLALKFAPLPANVLKDLEEIMQPAPPPPPDPLNTALLDSQAKYQYAQANKLNVDAQALAIDKKMKQIESIFAPAKEASDIKLTQAKTATELRKAHTDKHKTFLDHHSAFMNHESHKQSLIDSRVNNLATIATLNDRSNNDRSSTTKQ